MGHHHKKKLTKKYKTEIKTTTSALYSNNCNMMLRPMISQKKT